MFSRTPKVKDYLGKQLPRSQQDKPPKYSGSGSRCVTESIMGKCGAWVASGTRLISFYFC